MSVRLSLFLVSSIKRYPILFYCSGMFYKEAGLEMGNPEPRAALSTPEGSLVGVFRSALYPERGGAGSYSFGEDLPSTPSASL